MRTRKFRLVKATRLNLRTGPGTDFPAIALLERGKSLEVVGQVSGWFAALVGGYLAGWVSERYTLEHPTPWLGLAERELGIGVRELAGVAHDPQIIEYHSETLLKATRDETPWCSAFVCYCLERVGIPSTKSAAARSWIGWGRIIEKPVHGCIAIFRRGGNPAQGHVAFYLGESKDGRRIQVLGGNQGNQVSIATYAATDLIGYRVPTSYP